MRRSQLADAFARRLNIDRGRIDSLGIRAADAGLVPKTEGSRRYPAELSADEAANLFLAALTDAGLGRVHRQVRTFANLTDPDGRGLHSALAGLFATDQASRGAATGSLIVRLDPASVALTAGGYHARYGPEPAPAAAGKHVIVPGPALAAIGLEFNGYSPDEADALVAIARVSATVGLAA